MHLRRLELHGFKSFAHKTTLTFDDGITCIVGPNGCGKSNIVDAVRWAIGEQRAKALRSDKMEGVIFNGTSSRRPVGMGEVLLTVENSRGILPTEYANVTLGRRFYRSGEGEYLLNGVTCRLRDIQDLFMDTGMGSGAYSVIELAKVDQLLSDNADDRRRLFEEAAGITKFKLRRRQTLNKLQGAQHDLTRLRDLVDEVEAQANSLERQAKKAARHRELDARRAELERWIALFEYDRLTTALAQHTSDLQAAEDFSRQAAASVTAKEAERERAESDRIVAEDERRTAQHALQSHLDTLRQAEAEARVAHERRDRSQADARRLSAQAEQLTKRLKELQADQSRITGDLEAARPEAQRAAEALSQAKAERDAAQEALDVSRGALRAATQSERQAQQQHADARRALDRQLAAVDLHAAERDRLIAAPTLDDDAEHEVEIERAQRVAEQAERQAEEAKQRIDTAEAEAQQHRVDLEASSIVLRDAERQLDAHQAEAHVLRQIVNATRDFSEGVRTLAETPAVHGGAFSTVDDVVVPMAGWERAVAVALAEWRRCVIVDDDTAAEHAVAVLREKGAGQVTLLVRETASRSETTRPPDGWTALSEHVQVGGENRPVIELLLEGWCVVEVLPDAHDVPPGLRAIVADGSWVGAPLPGSLQVAASRFGGAPDSGAPAPTRAEQRKRLATLEDQIDIAQHAVDTAQRNVDDLRIDDRAALRELRQQADQAATQVRKAQQMLDRATLARESAANAQRLHAERIEQAEAAQRSAREALPSLEQAEHASANELSTAQDRVRNAESDAHVSETAARDVFSAFTSATLAASQAGARLEALEREAQRAARISVETGEQRDRDATQAQAERESALEREREVIEAQAEVARLADAREPLDQAVQESEDAVLEAASTMSEVEKKVREARREQSQASERMSAVAVAQAQVAARRDALEEEWAASHETTLTDDTGDVPDGFDSGGAREELADLKSKLSRIGAVNALAVEDYEAASERLTFLREQQQDLEEAESLLEETIAEIDAAASSRFEKTFAQIQQSFQTLFVDLFGEGARAELTLADPDDLLDSPVEIFARPSGKRPASIAQLSGGEKTLTAIALLFAIYLVKPSPFCILDEVDAPLDEANVDRFMRIIRRFSDQTQFILVTHNKRTMELSDRLYGVTMQEPGVSKLVSVRFDEAAELVG